VRAGREVNPGPLLPSKQQDDANENDFIYDARDLPSGHLDAHRLAVLADALTDAGCTDQNILAHCRGPGPHVRGCWVIDLLLGKV
jgi:hypothetical protein